VANVRRAKKRSRLSEERVRRLDALAFDWVLKPGIAATWEERINELKAFRKENGHCKVPFRYPLNTELGHWVAQIRKRQKRGELDREQFRSLNALGFWWSPLDTWGRHIHDLKAFKKEHGHCNVPCRYPPNPTLGNWVNTIRQWKNRSRLTEEQILILDALGFSWSMKQRGVQVPWEERIKDLKAFKKKHGHCNVPAGYQPNPTLGSWVYNLRQRRKQGKLAEDKIRILDALGFYWGRRGKSKLPKKQR
jgi:hypothetical protein